MCYKLQYKKGQEMEKWLRKTRVVKIEGQNFIFQRITFPGPKASGHSLNQFRLLEQNILPWAIYKQKSIAPGAGGLEVLIPTDSLSGVTVYFKDRAFLLCPHLQNGLTSLL